MFLVVATVLEVTGDAIVRKALYEALARPASDCSWQAQRCC
jgi:hypothetical protein